MSQQKLCPTLRPCSGKRSSEANRTEIYQWMKSISSQEDFPVSRSRAPGSEQARRMTAFSGRKCCALLRRPGPVSSLLRTCLESSAWSSTIVYLRWRPKATPAGRSWFQLVPSMPHTAGTESGLWPTATVMDSAGFCGKRDAGRTGPNSGRTLTGKALEMEGMGPHAKMWPTPNSGDGERGANLPDGKRGLKLTDCVRNGSPMWPTPQARDCNTIDKCRRGANSPGGTPLGVAVEREEIARMLPTPQGSDWKGADLARKENRTGKRHAGDDLPTAVATEYWPTPSSRDYKGQNGPNHLQKSRGHHDQLPNALAMKGITGQLNPTWVEWLMGFPIGWTDLERSETQSCPRSPRK